MTEDDKNDLDIVKEKVEKELVDFDKQLEKVSKDHFEYVPIKYEIVLKTPRKTTPSDSLNGI
jgi:hypothetical protein